MVGLYSALLASMKTIAQTTPLMATRKHSSGVQECKISLFSLLLLFIIIFEFFESTFILLWLLIFVIMTIIDLSVTM
jgi:hypothetical protein